MGGWFPGVRAIGHARSLSGLRCTRPSQRYRRIRSSSKASSNNIEHVSSRSFQWGVPFGVSIAAAVGGMFGSGLTNQVLNQSEAPSKQEERVRKYREIAREQSKFSDKPHDCSDVEWYKDIASEPGSKKVLSADDLLQEKHPILEDDHMFSAFVARGLINDIEGYFIKDRKEFKAIVALGREVAGFPRIVHGGLTAAIFDEVFGGLLFCLKSNNASFNILDRLPSYTVSLEVAYKAKIAADSTILCTAIVDKVEGRKMYMTAELRDGPNGKIFATSKALFVRPRLSKFIVDLSKYLISR
jgi:acyl-coenzyme A thioesterase PaaI-like protein